MSRACFRPLVQSDLHRPDGAVPLAGGNLWFDRAEVLERGRKPVLVEVSAIPPADLDRLTQARAPVAGLDWQHPRLMGVLNVTPDSFSDGGLFLEPERAVVQAKAMVAEGADIIDIGGESTRPGAEPVPEAEELRRVVPVIRALRNAGVSVTVSVDTRKPEVARAAVAAGASIWNDVTALSHQPESLEVAAELGVPVCLMHAGGDPRTMQDDPRYEDVVLDVYDYLEGRIATCQAAGIGRGKIILDPGIGFGKTLAHNLALIRNLSLFHGLGCPLMLGVSRKRFIGALSGEGETARRGPGSGAAGLEGLRQGVQILRVHDMAATAQAVAVWRGLTGQV